MATTPKTMYRGNAATSSTTLYTVPAGTTSVITNICVTNTDAASQTFTIALNGTTLFNTNSVAANTTTNISLKQVLSATQTITGLASATTIRFHISGVEIV